MSDTTQRNLFGEICLICENQKGKGIHLYTSFICTDCEDEIIHTQTNHPKYKLFIERMRKITKPTIFT